MIIVNKENRVVGSGVEIYFTDELEKDLGVKDAIKVIVSYDYQDSFFITDEDRFEYPIYEDTTQPEVGKTYSVVVADGNYIYTELNSLN